MRGNLSLLADFEQQRRTVLRLEEGFRLEKDEALAIGSRDILLRLRERSRTHYQPEISRVRMEIVRLSALLIPGEEWFEEGISTANTLQKRVDEAMTRFIGAPNRLLRNSETIAQLVGTRGPSGAGITGPSEGEEEQLQPTCPPVSCPACGTWLLSDKEFTVLVCPGCGARESLEPEKPQHEAD
jgi:hypothetical protein